MLSVTELLFLAGLLLLLGTFFSKISSRFGVPALVLFLALGMLAGSEGIGGIYFDDPLLAQLIGVISLVLILFSGGLDTDWKTVKPILAPALSLATLGVLITAVLAGLFCVWVLKFSLLQGILLGAIISSTDAAAVFSILKDRNVRLRKDLAYLLEVESGTNDPMAVFLTVSVIQLLNLGWGQLDRVVISFFWQMGVGLALGWGLGKAASTILSRITLPSSGLYPVFSTAIAFFSFGLASLVGGSGFLAVYLVGLVLGNSEIQFKTTLVRFHEAVAWMAQIVMFVTLGLLVFPHDLLQVILPSLAIAFFLMLVARPVAVFLSLFWAKLNLAQLTITSWVGLRGAVPIILATYPLLSGVEKSHDIFNIVFFVVLSSSLFQGTTVSWLAEKLGVSRELSRFLPSVTFPVTPRLETEILQFQIFEGSQMVGRRIEELHLPAEAGVCLVLREDKVLPPHQVLQLEAGDTVFVLAGPESIPRIREIFSE
ncbi:MAG: K+/H+ antiporter [candidate division Zixibacteria bacterium RBG_16_50_21]|nr:MAG: K+/H+ antiporter [candidate division Zixibacteria bacterium RBG_16_50_21]